MPKTAIVAWLALAGTVASGPRLGAQAAQDRAPASADAIARLERELAALRSEYGEKLLALERQIRALQESAPAPASAPARPGAAAPEAGTAPPPPEPAMQAPPPAAVAPLPPESAQGLPAPPAAVAPPPPGAPAPFSSSKVFNPDIAVIGNFLGAAGRNDTETAPPALDLDEAEASFQAVVDPYARADFFFAFSPEGVEVEEGFVTFPTLPGKLLLKAGKLRAGFGKVNTMHTHALPWTDRPLVTQNLLGGDEGISDAGLSLARLIPLGETFFEATAEVYRGESAVFRAPQRQDLTYGGRLRAYRDLGESANLDLGGSILYGHNGQAEDTATRLIGVDLTFRYRPLRRAIYKRFLARSELVWSRAEIDGSLSQDSFGGYFSAEYQFARRWFAGLRLDTSGHAFDDLPNDKGGSLLLTFWPSEFSQVRSQWRYTRLGAGGTNNEVLVQLLFTIGAHGAHAF